MSTLADKAFEADRNAELGTKVEDLYKRAIQQQGEDLLLRSRWINYLITRGNTQDAMIEISTISEDIRTFSPNDYTTFHLSILKTLLHSSQLTQARKVYDSIPDSVRNEGQFKLARNLLECFEDARDNMPYPECAFPVTPYIQHGRSYWSKGPILLSSSGLERWYLLALCDMDLDKDTLSFTTRGPVDKVDRSSTTFEQFGSWLESDQSLLDKVRELGTDEALLSYNGRFGEVGVYSGDRVAVIMFPEKRENEDDFFRALEPELDLNRYLRDWIF